MARSSFIPDDFAPGTPAEPPPRQPTDAELLAALTGDAEETFWCLWHRHQASLHQVCLQEMNGHAADAEDALSQVMLKTLACLPAHALEIRHLKAWLQQMTRNFCMDLRRKQQHQSEIAENWKLIALTEPKHEPPMVHAERDAEIQQQIAALPATLREPFELHIVQEIPAKQVAAQLGLSAANVRKRVQLARARLRGQIKSRLAEKPADAAQTRLPGREAVSGGSIELGECSPAVIRTVRVNLACGVEELFHVFSARKPFAPGRKIRSLRSRLSRHPDGCEDRVKLGDLLHGDGEWLMAVDEWQRALALQPHLPTALKLGRVLLQLGQSDDATRVFKGIRQGKFPSAAVARHVEGWIAYGQQDARRSAMAFEGGAELEPGNPVHWHALALAHRLAGKLPEARRAIQRALQLNANDLVALSLGHAIWVADGDLPEAIRRAQQLLALAPHDLLTLRRLVDCRCRLQLGADSETKQLMRRALRRSQNSDLMHETLAAFFLAQGEPEKALAVRRKFADQHPHCRAGRQRYLTLRGGGGPLEHPDAEPPGGKISISRAQECTGDCHAQETPSLGGGEVKFVGALAAAKVKVG